MTGMCVCVRDIYICIYIYIYIYIYPGKRTARAGPAELLGGRDARADALGGGGALGDGPGRDGEHVVVQQRLRARTGDVILM